MNLLYPVIFKVALLKLHGQLILYAPPAMDVSTYNKSLKIRS